MKKTLFSILISIVFCSAFAQEKPFDPNTDSITSERVTNEYSGVQSNSTYQTKGKIYGTTDLAAIVDGSISGIQVTDNGAPGATGNFLIRGFHSIDGSDAPFIVVDGFPYFADLNSINSLDIESITVLKSADAWLKYGLRGSHGVIEINTRKGHLIKEPLKITIDASIGINNRAFPTYSVIKNEKDFYETAWDKLRNETYNYSGDLNFSGQSASYNLIEQLGGYNSYNVPDSQLINPLTGKLNPNAQLKYHGDNWEKEFQRTALRHEYNVSVLKNGNKGSILFSAGYLNEQGYIKATDFERFTSRINGQLKLTKWMKAGLNASFSNTNDHIPNISGTQSNPIYVGQIMAPIYPYFIRNEEGEKVIDPKTGDYKYDMGDETSGTQFPYRPLAAGEDILSSFQMQHKENKNLNNEWSVNPYLKFNFLKDLYFISQFNVSRNSLESNILFVLPGNNIRSLTDANQTNYSTNQKLTWNKKMNRHNVKADVGYETWNYKWKYQNRSIDENIGSGSTKIEELREVRQGFNSFLGEVNYNYDAKYFISGGIRKEKTIIDQNFTTWNAGAAWDIAQTKLLKDKASINLLKLWGNYGSVSNNNFYYPGNIQALKATKTLDLGLDFSLLQSRIRGTLQVFNRSGNSGIFNLSGSTGMPDRSYIIEFKTQGAELSLNFIPIEKKNLLWNININLSHYTSEVLNTNGLNNIFQSMRGFAVGQPLFSIFGYKSMDVNPVTGEELFATEINGQETTTSELNKAKIYFLGSTEPDLYGGFSNRVIYKNWDFSFKLTFAMGGKYFDQVYRDLMLDSYSRNIGLNWSTDILDRWTIEHPDAEIPKLSRSSNNEPSLNSRFITSASYLKVSNVTLAYAFKEKKIAQMKLDKLSIYISAYNLWMWSARKGLDPQLSFYNDVPYAYAPMRTIVFGLKLAL